MKELTLGLRELILYEGANSRSNLNTLWISLGLLVCRIFQIVC